MKTKKRVRLSDADRNNVDFARFCIRYDVDPVDLAEVIALTPQRTREG